MLAAEYEAGNRLVVNGVAAWLETCQFALFGTRSFKTFVRRAGALMLMVETMPCVIVILNGGVAF